MNLISLKEYAQLHNVDPSTVRHKVLRGNLNAFKIGRNWVIDKNEPYNDLRYKNRQSDRHTSDSGE